MLGLDPFKQRKNLMRNICFIADVAVLPGWIKVTQLLDFTESTHPNFSRSHAEEFLSRTKVRPDARVRELSKGMIAQLHLSIIMAIDAKLLVLDEPTLGLDPIFRKEFYGNLLNDYFDEERTILITTHQVEEIENLMTDMKEYLKTAGDDAELPEGVSAPAARYKADDLRPRMRDSHAPEKARAILAGLGGATNVQQAEAVAETRLRVALVYPNTYAVGMSNLGFQTVYRLLNDTDHVVCERAFAPDTKSSSSMLIGPR